MDYSTSTTFGDRLRRYRLAAGLTQEELAERTGLGVRSIQHLEGGGHLPHCDTLGRLIEGLGLNGGERNELERLARPAPRAAETASGPPVQQFDHAPRHNLPTQLTSFVGRDREQAEATRLLGTTRLLTITGVGGTGKTRLALKVASDAIASYSEGVWFVDLAPVADPAVVPRTIASVLGVTEQSGESVLATVLRVMRDRQVLLILDNCEHLIDACARLTDALLRGCPRVQILATSREALGIAGEVTWSLPSLPVPTADWQAAHRGDSVVALSDVAAIRLFVDRARAAEPGFNVSDQNIAAVIQICRRVDGIPLAIELAAARVKVFSVERISGRLDNLFRLLTGGSRTALPRQQTLKATIDWSHDLLTEPERVLFRRLSVFVGGCSYEAIEGVCTGDGIDMVDVADLLTRLVERSLVVVEQLDRERYRLLETLRQYGRDRLLEAGEAEAVRDRHCDWFLELAERVAPELIGPHQVAWLDRLDNEQDNLRAALAWCLEGRPAIVGLRLAGAMWRWWHVRDREREGSEWLRRVLAAPGAQGATAARATALQGMTELPALAEGIASVEAQQAAEESVAICQEIGDLAGAAWSMNMIGRRAAFRGDGAQAESLLEQALALARQVGARWAEAQILEGFGYLAGFRDDVPKERRYFEEALALFRALDDRRAIAWASMGVGVAAGVLGDTTTARATKRSAQH